MSVIYIRPADGWGYFIKNKTRLSNELVEIATNEETKTSVYMTEEDDKPYLYVYRDDKKVFQSSCTTIYETESSLRAIYAQYLTDLKAAGGGADGDDDANDDTPPCSELDSMTDAEFQDYVDEREDTIFDAVSDLIAVLTEDSIGALEFDQTDGECIDDIIDHIVEYLAIKCGFRIRRPMIVVDDETGLDVRTEYPYEEFDFGDAELHG